jgi:hypothetical protein
MKPVTFILSFLLCILITSASAQEKSTLDTAQNPVPQGDPAVSQSPEEIRQNELRDMIKISADDIPPSLQNALKGDDYKGGSKTYYRSKSGDTYLVEIQDGNITQTYRFDKKGKQINSN